MITFIFLHSYLHIDRYTIPLDSHRSIHPTHYMHYVHYILAHPPVYRYQKTQYFFPQVNRDVTSILKLMSQDNPVHNWTPIMLNIPLPRVSD